MTPFTASIYTHIITQCAVLCCADASVGLFMTPFALAHLSVSWTGLTSLSLNVPAPPPQPIAAAAGAGGVGAAAASSVLHSAAGQLFASLGSMQSLKHLNLTLSGEHQIQSYTLAGQLPRYSLRHLTI